jgi:3-hydroxyacyl-[acyl-carrier-protein] dehydratase
VPGVLLCEAAMQCGAILLSGQLAKMADKVPVATRMNDVRFKRMVRPGETIRMEVQLCERLADAFFLKAKVTVDGHVAVRFEFACTAAAKGPIA